MVQPEQPWLRVDELAAKEGVSKRTVYRWLKQGKVESRESGEIMLQGYHVPDNNRTMQIKGDL